MRYLWLALLGVALFSPLARAQQPPQPPPAGAPAARDPLDEALVRWERAMSGIASLKAQCIRTTVDKSFQTTEIYEGEAKYLKTAGVNLASLEMYKRGRKDVFEKYICTGTFLYEYKPQNKVIHVHDLPKPPPGQVSDDNFLSFLFGMKAAEAKRRYQLTWVPPPANDRWYYYIDIRSREKADQADFSRARLVLSASTFLPRQLWFEQPNGNEVTWDFPQLTTGAGLRAQEFAEPRPPDGWQMIRVPREQPPQQPQRPVIRGQN
jgi:TIGR03009 family protein